MKKLRDLFSRHISVRDVKTGKMIKVKTDDITSIGFDANGVLNIEYKQNNSKI